MNTPLLAALVPTLALLVLDALLGIAQAVKAGGLKAISAQKLPGVAEKAVAPVILAAGGSLVSVALSGITQGVSVTAITALIAALGVRALADVKAKAAELLG